MIPSIRLEGARELDKALKKLEGVAARKVALKAMNGALPPVADYARQLVPVRRGDLRDSIGVGANLTKRQKRLREPIAPVEVNVGPGITNKSGLRGVAHAHLVEFGTVKMAPHPYMKPAWIAKLDEVFTKLADNMRQALQDQID